MPKAQGAIELPDSLYVNKNRIVVPRRYDEGPNEHKNILSNVETIFKEYPDLHKDKRSILLFGRRNHKTEISEGVTVIFRSKAKNNKYNVYGYVGSGETAMNVMNKKNISSNIKKLESYLRKEKINFKRIAYEEIVPEEIPHGQLWYEAKINDLEIKWFNSGCCMQEVSINAPKRKHPSSEMIFNDALEVAKVLEVADKVFMPFFDEIAAAIPDGF